MAEPDRPPFHRFPTYGREREQQVLRDYLRAALAGQGSIALISGESGIGKSTLVDEAVWDARSAGATVLTGGCYDLATTPPYGPWREMARSYPVDDPLPPFPPSLRGEDGLTAARSQAAFFDEVVRFLAEASSARPLVLVLEDLHWSDQASLDLLRVIARQVVADPLFLLATYRPEDVVRDTPLHRVLPLLIREARAWRIDLRRLDRGAIEALVAARYPLEDDGLRRLVDYLDRHAEGNPFYTLELLRGLEDDGLLRFAADGWHVGDVERLQVPRLLRQVIDARLARLDPLVQQRLTVAAVIGQDVPLSLCGSVLSIPDDDLLTTVESAADAQVIDPSPDGTAIRFHHALIRDALYQSILPPRRRVLHGTIGAILAASPHPDADAVAWHFQQAGDLRAGEWLIRASERAQRSYAWSAAAERLVAAEDFLDAADVRGRGWLRYRIGRLRRHADAIDAILWLKEAERLGERAGDPVLTAYARFDLGHAQVLTGDYTHGLERMLAGVALLDALPADHAPAGSEIAAWVADALPGGEQVRAGAEPHREEAGINPRHGVLIQWLVEPGRYRQAQALGEAYVNEVAAGPTPTEQTLSSSGDAWFGLGRIYAALGQPGRARQALATAQDCYERIEHHLLISATLRIDLTEVLIPYQTTNLNERRRIAAAAAEAHQRATGILPSHLPAGITSVELLVLEGAWSEARALLEPMAGRTAAMAPWRQRAASLLGRLAREQGDLDRAWTHVLDVLPAGPDTVPGTTGFTRAIELQLVAVDLTLDRGDTDRAGAWLRALDRWLTWGDTVRWQAEAHVAWARYHQATGEGPEARRRARAALACARRPHQPLALLAAHRVLGELDTSEGRYASASRHLRASAALADACAAPYERALTTMALAELHVATGAADEARRLLDDACPVFERLDATGALARAHRLERRLAGSPAAAARPFGLSNRELEVLRLVAQGMTDAEIAEHLFISYRTVTSHVSSIFNKLGVNSRVSATRVAVEHGLV